MLTPLVTLLVLLGQSQTEAKAKPKLAVFEIQPLNGVTPELAQSLSAVLVLEVRKQAADYSVIGADEIRSLLSAERMRQQLGCAQAACLAEIGGALGASRIVNGQISKLGSVYVLTVKLLDTRKGAVVRDTSDRIASGDQAELLSAVQRVANRLFLTELSAPDDTGSDLFAENAPAPEGGRSHAAAFVLGGLAVVAAGFAVAGLTVVQSYNGNVGTWNAQAKSGALSVSGGSIQSQMNGANTWAAVGFVGLGAAVLSAGGAVLAW